MVPIHRKMVRLNCVQGHGGMCPHPHPGHRYAPGASVRCRGVSVVSHFHPHIEKPMPHWQCQCWPVAMAGGTPRQVSGKPGHRRIRMVMALMGTPHRHSPSPHGRHVGCDPPRCPLDWPARLQHNRPRATLCLWTARRVNATSESGSPLTLSFRSRSKRKSSGATI
jgi:hypothetical protein